VVWERICPVLFAIDVRALVVILFVYALGFAGPITSSLGSVLALVSCACSFLSWYLPPFWAL